MLCKAQMAPTVLQESLENLSLARMVVLPLQPPPFPHIHHEMPGDKFT